jgi:hypothetical protein
MLRFQRRIKIAPGLRLNLSKSGASVSAGHRGFWYTVGPRGERATIGLPGSGLFWTQTRAGTPQTRSGGRALLIAIGIILAAAFLFGGR